jgi:hypothetical protein
MLLHLFANLHVSPRSLGAKAIFTGTYIRGGAFAFAAQLLRQALLPLRGRLGPQRRVLGYFFPTRRTGKLTSADLGSVDGGKQVRGTRWDQHPFFPLEGSGFFGFL